MFSNKIRFDRNELSGAFGDIGTDLPLLIGMISAAGLDSASVLITFGIMQIFTSLVYGVPMPVQPLKAVATIVIAQKIAPSVIYGAGLAIGIVMLMLTLTGLISLVAEYIPKVVVRGIQFGLGIQLAMVACKNYVLAESYQGYIVAGVSFLITVILLGNRKYPPALFIISLGIIYSLLLHFKNFNIVNSIGISLPRFYIANWNDILTGFIVLSLPQIPLSIGNSIIATKQLLTDYFPEKKVTVRKISLTYSIMNIVNPFLSGIPTCHGSGGMAGHYAFGARTGGSVFIYGVLYLVIGLFFSKGFEQVVKIFPLPVLGVILLFEGVSLMILIKDIVAWENGFLIAVLVGLIAAGLPYGFLIGIIVGTIIFYTVSKK